MANHYAPPQANVDDVAPAGQGITGEMIEALRGTKGWVLLIGIMTLIGAGFMVLGGIGMLFGSAFMGAAGAGAPQAAVFVGMGALYIVLAILYIFPGLFLIKYSSAIGRLVNSGQSNDMEDALNQQRKFWKFVGVLFIVGMVVGILGVIAAIALPAYMMASGGLR